MIVTAVAAADWTEAPAALAALWAAAAAAWVAAGWTGVLAVMRAVAAAARVLVALTAVLAVLAVEGGDALAALLRAAAAAAHGMRRSPSTGTWSSRPAGVAPLPPLARRTAVAAVALVRMGDWPS